MPKRRMGTLQDLITNQDAKLRSKPALPGQEFLDLFMLSRMKARYEQDHDRGSRGLNKVIRGMKDTYSRIEEPDGHKAALKQAKESPPAKEARKVKRPMTIEY